MNETGEQLGRAPLRADAALNASTYRRWVASNARGLRDELCTRYMQDLACLLGAAHAVRTCPEQTRVAAAAANS